MGGRKCRGEPVGLTADCLKILLRQMPDTLTFLKEGELMMFKKLPIGIQSFEKLREDNFLYVDKTALIYELVHNNTPYFLSRPRRFGKSLLLSTMKAYWEGKKDLFSGLAIEKLEERNMSSWQTYPVFYFDFNGMNYQQEHALEDALHSQLKRFENFYGFDNSGLTLNERFQNLLIKAHNQAGLRCVVLIDEYDKPLLDVIETPELHKHNKEVFKGFFSILKSFDEYIQFIFITGVSKFHKVSIFSDLNQLNDISLTEDYAELCGMTEEEIQKYLYAYLDILADKRGLRKEDCIRLLRAQYDGYHFHPDSVSVYNPFSLMKALYEKNFGSYWFETGTPTFLIKQLKESHFDVRKFTDSSIYAAEETLKDYTGEEPDPVPLLYQTGYLTISSYDSRRQRYTLSFPNEEVTYGFLNCLMPAFVPKATAGNGLDIYTLDEYIENGQLDKIRDVLAALFANITYTFESDPFEHYFQTVIYLVFTLLGKFCMCEMHTYSGRIDCKVETSDYIYLFEFKRDDTADAALKQIDSKDYALAFSADNRKLYKIGVSFDSAQRKLAGWKVAEH